jgi:hypothetical protein
MNVHGCRQGQVDATPSARSPSAGLFVVSANRADPIRPRQPGQSLEFGELVGDQYQALDAGVGGELQVIDTDGLPLEQTGALVDPAQILRHLCTLVGTVKDRAPADCGGDLRSAFSLKTPITSSGRRSSTSMTA